MYISEIILVQAKYIDAYGAMKKAAGTYFPLGIGYIAAVLKQNGIKVKFFDPNVQDISSKAIANYAIKNNIKLLGINFMTPQFRYAKELISDLKNMCPSLKIVAGGAHPSAMPKHTLKEISDCDFVLCGESEYSTLDLINKLHEKNQYNTINGLGYRNDNEIIVNPPGLPIEDLDKLPFPDRSIIDQSLYHQQSFLSYYKNSISIYTSRGCQGRCTFCASGHKLKSKVRQRSIKNIMEEITFLKKHYNVDYIIIKDDSFTFSRARIIEFCKEYKKKFPKLPWHCMGRVNIMDDDLVRTMKSAGLNDIFIGIESGSSDVLKKTKKGITLDQVRKAVTACSKFQVRTTGAFILGLPGESKKSIQQTIDFAKSIPLDIANFSILIPYPGTEIFEEYLSKHDNLNYDCFIASTGYHYVKEYNGMLDLKPEDLPKYQSKALREFYLRPKQILRLMKSTTPRMFLGYLKAFYALILKEIKRRMI